LYTNVLLLARKGVHCLQVENKDDLKSRRLFNAKESLVLLCLLAKKCTFSASKREQRRSQKSLFIEH
jgi:hypothetical protein